MQGGRPPILVLSTLFSVDLVFLFPQIRRPAVPVALRNLTRDLLLLRSADTNTKRETGRKAQLGNIQAAKVSLSRQIHFKAASLSTPSCTFLVSSVLAIYFTHLPC